jgi:signal peptidase II
MRFGETITTARGWTVGIAGAGVALDQLTKHLVVERWGPGSAEHRKAFIGDWLGIHYVENTGVAFGLLRGQTVLVTVLVIVALAVVVTAFRRQADQSPIMVAGRALLLAGAIGNLVDRFRHGFVVDFVEVWRWPKFNLADAMITVGMLLLAWGYARVDDTVGERERTRGDRGIRAY